jgi:hypothetical protein
MELDGSLIEDDALAGLLSVAVTRINMQGIKKQKNPMIFRPSALTTTRMSEKSPRKI